MPDKWGNLVIVLAIGTMEMLGAVFVQTAPLRMAILRTATRRYAIRRRPSPANLCVQREQHIVSTSISVVGLVIIVPYMGAFRSGRSSAAVVIATQARNVLAEEDVFQLELSIVATTTANQEKDARAVTEPVLPQATPTAGLILANPASIAAA